jgi:hypothetical protein
MSDAEFIFQQGPKAFIQVWRKVMLDPRSFYRDMPASGGFQNPLIFLAICGALFFVLKVIVDGPVGGVNALFLACLAYIFGPGILMLACLYLFHGEGDYEGSLRICAYAGACLTLAWIPRLWIFAVLYGFYLIFLGTEKVHKLDTTKAAIATLVGVLVTAVIIFYVLGGEERVRRPLL